MRAVPGCAVQQQALAAEAAAVVRNAVALARRRGHAQVTPLHVATVMLSSSPSSPAPSGPGPGPGLLRAACLRSSSRSHPLQCKALELCFNVALNRLPTAFHGGGSPPALSNALVAAFKRAQAHHRRGESSSPAPVLAGHGGGTKVELEQLVVSILDDPSVSRVMREAGFSSALVKANAAVLERESTTPKPSPPSDHPHRAATRKLNNGGHGGGGGIEDAMKVLECMASGQHRCLVAVDSGAGAGGNGGARAERAVKAVMDMVSKAELPRWQNYKQLACVQFVPLSVSSFRAAARAEVDTKAGELRGLAREAQRAGKGLVVVVQDLAWAADFWADTRSRSSRSCNGGSSSLQDDYYCPVEHAVMEVSGLVHEMRGGGGGGRFWMLGFASEAVFSRCRAGRPSLADVWGIHPVVFPGDGGLALSRSCFSGTGRPGWPPLVVINGAGEMSDEFTCCAGTWPEEPMSIIPPWLRRYHDPNLAAPPSSCGTDLQQSGLVQDLWKPTMRSNGSSAARRHTSELTLSFSSPPSPSPAPAASDRNYYSKQQPWQSLDPQQQLQLHLRATTTPSPPECTSAQSSSSGGGCSRSWPRFTELTAENLKTLCTALEGPHVPPRCKDLAPAVASAVLQRRSGVTTRQRRRTTWLVFRGDDGEGKKAMAMELSRLVFGSYADFACMRISISADHSVVVSPSSGEFVPATTTTLKRRRSRSPDDGRHGCACAQSTKLYEALRENPRRVIMVDGAEQLDINNGCIKEVIATGRMRCSSSAGNGGGGGDSVGLEDAIVVLSFDDSRPRVKSQRVLIGDDEEEGGGGVGMEDGPAKKKKSPPSFSLDLNSCAAGDEEEETGNLVEDDDVEIGDDVDGVFFFQLPRDLSH